MISRSESLPRSLRASRAFEGVLVLLNKKGLLEALPPEVAFQHWATNEVLIKVEYHERPR